MKSQNLCKEDGSYLIGYCCLHTLQLTLANAIQKRIGPGKLGSRNATQLIHSIYDLQTTTEVDLWRKLYFKAAGNLDISNVKFKKIAAPIITRWWTVGVADSDFLDKFPIFLELCKLLRNVYTSENSRNKISSSILSLSREAVIISDVNLIACYHDAFLNKNFAWLQKGDTAIGNSPGFLGRHMLARYYLMHLQLNKLMNSGWKQSEAMQKFALHLEQEEMRQEMDDPVNTNQRITYKTFQERKADLFFSDSLKALEKHYTCYSQELLFLSLYGKAFVTQTVARILLNKDCPQLADGFLFKSEVHQAQVNILDFAKFVKDRIIVSDQLLSFHIQRIDKDELQKLAGKFTNNPPYTFKFLLFLFAHLFPTRWSRRSNIVRSLQTLVKI